MTNFTVGPTPLQVIGQGVNNAPLTVQNTGAVSVYISADPGVNPNFYAYKIDAGGDFIWPNGTPLSVCTGPGVKGQISYGGNGEVHVNSGSTNVTGAVTINGTVPITGPVTVSGSVALNAGSTVAVSGPVSIAGTVPISGNVNVTGSTIAISGTVPVSGNVNITGGSIGLSGPVAISGGVSVTGSTINVGTIRNAVDLLFTYNTVIAANTAITITTLTAAQLINYQTLIITAPAQNVGANTSVSSIFIQWANASGLVTATDSPIMYSNGQLNYVIPIKGVTANIIVQTSPGGTHNALPIQIFGSVYLLPRSYYSSPPIIGQFSQLTMGQLSDASGAGMFGLDATPNAAINSLSFLPSKSGMCYLTINIPQATTTNFVLNSLDRVGNASTATRLYQAFTTAITQPNPIPMIMPEAPLVMSLGPSTTARVLFTIFWGLV